MFELDAGISCVVHHVASPVAASGKTPTELGLEVRHHILVASAAIQRIVPPSCNEGPQGWIKQHCAAQPGRAAPRRTITRTNGARCQRARAATLFSLVPLPALAD